MTRRTQTSAFTLIELLVVIAIIALLIGILLPALGTARKTAWALVDQTQLRSLATGQAVYLTDNKDYYAAVNTSGWDGQRASGGQPYVFNTTAETPTSVFDFISPTVGQELGFSANRARRLGDILNDFADPAARELNSELFPGGTSPADIDELDEYLTENRGYRQISYLMPGAFMYWGTPARGGFVPGQGSTPNDTERWASRFGFVPRSWTDSISSQVHTPRNFRNRIDQVGISPSNKIMIANGTRYFVDGLLDFDPSVTPELFGSFSSGTPQWTGNTAYGTNGPGAPENLRLSFRHGNSSINVVHFDGSTENLTQREVYTDMSKWAPSGSVVVDTGRLTPEAREYAQNLPDGTSGAGGRGKKLP
ncbi:MAG: prepilin-type N-terminal cleavage/methylation domain-containing protein [Planctomycetota bacterium]